MAECKLLIVGLGLLGGSLAKALHGKPCVRLGWTRRADVRARALADGAIDVSADDPAELVAQADLTVIALPIAPTLAFLEMFSAHWKKGAVVTDVSSVKRAVMAQAARCLPRGVSFVGSHPMAGTEFSGYEHAQATLYDNADVFVTLPASEPDEDAAHKVEELWLSLGCRPRRIDAGTHDKLVARTSHALHVVASAASTSVLGVPKGAAQKLRFEGCAGGFRDTSRIASSNPAMWRAIMEYNRDEVLAALDGFEEHLRRFRSSIERGDFAEFEREFARGAALRDAWLEYRKEAGK